MKEKIEDILTKGYDAEAEEISREVVAREAADPEFAALKADDSMKQEFLRKLRARENASVEMSEELVPEIPSDFGEDEKILAQMSKEGQEAYRLGREIMEKRAAQESAKEPDMERTGDDTGNTGGASTDSSSGKVVRFRRKRVYLLVALVAILVMAFGMTSIGGKNYVMDMVNEILAGKEQMTLDSKEEDRKYSERENDEVYAQIDEKLGIDTVALGYLPQHYELETADIDAESDMAYISYSDGKDGWIQYYIFSNQNDQSFSIYHDENMLKEEEIIISEIPIKILEYQDPDTGRYFEAQYVYNNVNYSLWANMKYVEFEKILNNLFFY